jgi:hypothetical protein
MIYAMAHHLASGILICSSCNKAFKYTPKMQDKYSPGKDKYIYHKYRLSHPQCKEKSQYDEEAIDKAFAVLYFNYLIENVSESSEIQRDYLQRSKFQEQKKLIDAIKTDMLTMEQTRDYIGILHRIKIIETNATTSYQQSQAYKSFLLYQEGSVERRKKLIKRTLIKIMIKESTSYTSLYSLTSPKDLFLEDIEQKYVECQKLMNQMRTNADPTVIPRREDRINRNK